MISTTNHLERLGLRAIALYKARADYRRGLVSRSARNKLSDQLSNAIRYYLKTQEESPRCPTCATRLTAQTAQKPSFSRSLASISPDSGSSSQILGPPEDSTS